VTDGHNSSLLNLGLWLLFHPDLKRTNRVLAFRDYLVQEIASQSVI